MSGRHEVGLERFSITTLQAWRVAPLLLLMRPMMVDVLIYGRARHNGLMHYIEW